MGILDNINSKSSGRVRNLPFASATGINDEAKPKSKVWLNVGYEVNGKFVSLPLGLPIDTMDSAEIRGQNEDFVKLRTAQNELLEALKNAGQNMAPGQEQTVNLQVRLRRVNEELVVDRASNEYAIDFNGLFAA